MIEAEWDACADPDAMLELLETAGKLSDRKARLFAAACCRRVWEMLTDDRSRGAVEVSEQYGEGRVGRKALDAARRSAFSASKSPRYSAGRRLSPDAAGHAAVVALNVCRSPRTDRPVEIARSTAGCASSLVYRATGGGEAEERTAQCAILRDLFGNPLRQVFIDPAWLDWHGVVSRGIAGAISAESAFDRLPILADALEEAGCGDAGLLVHFRGAGPHYRGCWALDAVLGKL